MKAAGVCSTCKGYCGPQQGRLLGSSAEQDAGNHGCSRQVAGTGCPVLVPSHLQMSQLCQLLGGVKMK